MMRKRNVLVRVSLTGWTYSIKQYYYICLCCSHRMILTSIFYDHRFGLNPYRFTQLIHSMLYLEVESSVRWPNNKEVQLPCLNFQIPSTGWQRIFTVISTVDDGQTILLYSCNQNPLHIKLVMCHFPPQLPWSYYTVPGSFCELNKTFMYHWCFWL